VPHGGTAVFDVIAVSFIRRDLEPFYLLLEQKEKEQAKKKLNALAILRVRAVR
jgi:hypothetical protein